LEGAKPKDLEGAKPKDLEGAKRRPSDQAGAQPLAAPERNPKNRSPRDLATKRERSL